MVKLADEDIYTREVLEWKGIHLFHFGGSACSQKTRVFLNIKGIEWESHLVDLSAQENYRAWYLGINPRGLVPTLVIDGEVHIESNDLLIELERRYPEPTLIPRGREAEIGALLKHEDDLHLDLRTLTFRFMRPYKGPFRSAEALDQYRAGGSGTVLGKADANKQREIEFWESAADGIPDDAAKRSTEAFIEALSKLDEDLADQPYLLGERLTVLDIAWFIYANRLSLVGYPLEVLHPRVNAWFRGLAERPDFASEVGLPPAAADALNDFQSELRATGRALSDVAALGCGA